ncbi:MAG: ABC transporter permease subunit [Deltaproteobacteria bacterium]|nr:ABC transporter permease subunit [Deltaproteobacteria bacterium]
MFKSLVRLLAIVKKELISFFVSPFAYFILAAVTLLGLYFFIQYLSIYNFVIMQSRSQMMFGTQEGVSLNMFIQGYFKVLLLIFVFFLPMAAMRVFSEEKKSATFEFLLTSPISTESIVLGKLLGFIMYCTLVVVWLCLPPLSLLFLGELETLVVFGNMVGFWLYVVCLGSISVLISAASGSPITSSVIGMVILLLYYVLGYSAESLSQSGWENLAAVLKYISPVEQIEYFLRGAIKLNSVFYFASVMLVAYLLSVRVIESRRMSKI